MKFLRNLLIIVAVFPLFISISEVQAENFGLEIDGTTNFATITNELTRSYDGVVFSFVLSDENSKIITDDEDLVYANIRMNAKRMQEYCVPYSLLDKFSLNNNYSLMSDIKISQFGNLEPKKENHILGMLMR